MYTRKQHFLRSSLLSAGLSCPPFAPPHVSRSAHSSTHEPAYEHDHCYNALRDLLQVNNQLLIIALPFARPVVARVLHSSVARLEVVVIYGIDTMPPSYSAY